MKRSCLQKSSKIFFQMLNKKELKSCESPEPESGPYDQIPNKFPKMTNSEFDQLLKNQPLPDNTTNLVSSKYILLYDELVILNMELIITAIFRTQIRMICTTRQWQIIFQMIYSSQAM